MNDSLKASNVHIAKSSKSILSSRFTYDHTEGYKKTNVDLNSLKALYDQEIRKCNLFPPVAVNVLKPNHRSGYGISFQVSESRSDTQNQKSLHELHFNESLEYNVPYYGINEMAVTEGLKQKIEEYEQTQDILNEGYDNDADCTTFKGEIVSLTKPYLDSIQHFEKANLPVAASHSLRVVNSEFAQQTKIEDIWPWPWIDNKQSHRGLYKCKATQGHLDKADHGAHKKIPKLPCPHPAHTFKRYLESVEPLLTDYEFKNTKAVVKKFLQDEMPYLQTCLIGCNTISEENWVEKSLHNHDYCYSKQGPVVLNQSIIAPFCHDVWPPKVDSLIERAVVVIRIATEFWSLIRTETLKPIQDEKGNVADMKQFQYLFSSTLLPGTAKSLKRRLMKTKSEGETARHIAVLYKGNVFVMNVADDLYDPLSLVDIAESLKGLINYANSLHFVNEAVPNLIAASTEVEVWAKERHRLSMIKENEENFSVVDHAIFVLSLDHTRVDSLDTLANEAMFADGCNRWYYKGLNFYLHQNGYVTLNFNTRLLDGSTIAFLLHYMHLRIVEEGEAWDSNMAATDVNPKPGTPMNMLSMAQFITSDSMEKLASNQPKSQRGSAKNTELQMLKFSLDDISLNKMIESAKVFASLSEAVLTSVCKIDDFDREYFLKTGINKDAFSHLALQLSFFRIYYRVASMGTKLSIRKFANVRFDTLRSTNKEVAQWCKTYLDTSADQKTKNRLFWIAHKKIMLLFKECLNGEGYDNHLNAIRNLPEMDRIPLDTNVFKDKGFFQSGGGDRYEILAETLGVGCTACPVFVPRNPKGYAVGYSVAVSFLFFIVSSWKDESVVCAPLFAQSLKRTCQELLASPPEKVLKQNASGSCGKA